MRSGEISSKYIKCERYQNDEGEETAGTKLNIRSFLETLYNAGQAEDILNLFQLTSLHTENHNGQEIGIANFKQELAELDNSKLAITYCRSSTVKFYTEIQNYPKWDPMFLWYLPSMCCLLQISEMVKEKKLSGISSIGCGTGLLEWILTKLTGIDIVGYEINKEWWCCKYGPPKFIQHEYVDEMDAFPVIPKNRAIFCCYFNNMEVFRQYLQKYEGSLMIIIGSINGGRETNPGPMDFVRNKEWKLTKIHQSPQMDLIVFYERICL